MWIQSMLSKNNSYFEFFSKTIYLFINNYLVPFKETPFRYNTPKPAFFSIFENTSETRFLVSPTAPVTIFLLSPQS